MIGGTRWLIPTIVESPPEIYQTFEAEKNTLSHQSSEKYFRQKCFQ